MSIIIILILFIIVFITNYLFGYIFSKICKSRLKKISKGYLVLTYDDGPSKILEKKLLALLKRYNVRATFFLLGKKIEQYLPSYGRLKTHNHDIGIHAYEHLNAWKNSPWKIVSNIKRSITMFIHHIDKNMILFRPPHGKITLIDWIFFVKYKLNYIFWTHNSCDTYEVLPSIQSILDSINNSGGGVILMHSFDRDSSIKQDKRNNFVLELTESLIVNAKNNNWNICTVSELLKYSYKSNYK